MDFDFFGGGFLLKTDCPWGRGCHVPQADVRGAPSYHSPDPRSHRVSGHWHRRSLLQMLRQRHYCAHQDWQVIYIYVCVCVPWPMRPEQAKHVHAATASMSSLTYALCSQAACQLWQRSQSGLLLVTFLNLNLDISEVNFITVVIRPRLRGHNCDTWHRPAPAISWVTFLSEFCHIISLRFCLAAIWRIPSTIC